MTCSATKGTSRPHPSPSLRDCQKRGGGKNKNQKSAGTGVKLSSIHGRISIPRNSPYHQLSAQDVYKIVLVNIQSRRGEGSMGPTPNSGAVNTRWLLEEAESVFFKGIATACPHTHEYGQHNWVIFFFQVTQSRNRVSLRRVRGEYDDQSILHPYIKFLK